MDKLKGSLSEVSIISGTIDGIEIISGNIQGCIKINGNLSEMDTITGDLTIAQNEMDEYEGDVQITPKINETTLETRGKYLSQDVVVLPIPYYETSNESGYTVIIGGV